MPVFRRRINVVIFLPLFSNYTNFFFSLLQCHIQNIIFFHSYHTAATLPLKAHPIAPATSYSETTSYYSHPHTPSSYNSKQTNSDSPDPNYSHPSSRHQTPPPYSSPAEYSTSQTLSTPSHPIAQFSHRHFLALSMQHSPAHNCIVRCLGNCRKLNISRKQEIEWMNDLV